MIDTPNDDLKTWYALYTKPRWEKKVAALLSRKGIENYCPLNKVLRQWSDRKKVVFEPLFSSYVFVRVSLADQWRVKEADGVLNYVHWLGKPASIPDAEIELIKRFLNEHQQVQVVSTKPKVNDQVRIISGPFMDQEAAIVAVKGNRAEVQIPSLDLYLIASVKTSELEIIKS